SFGARASSAFAVAPASRAEGAWRARVRLAPWPIRRYHVAIVSHPTDLLQFCYDLFAWSDTQSDQFFLMRRKHLPSKLYLARSFRRLIRFSTDRLSGFFPTGGPMTKHVAPIVPLLGLIMMLGMRDVAIAGNSDYAEFDGTNPNNQGGSGAL